MQPVIYKRRKKQGDLQDKDRLQGAIPIQYQQGFCPSEWRDKRPLKFRTSSPQGSKESEDLFYFLVYFLKEEATMGKNNRNRKWNGGKNKEQFVLRGKIEELGDNVYSFAAKGQADRHCNATHGFTN